MTQKQEKGKIVIGQVKGKIESLDAQQHPGGLPNVGGREASSPIKAEFIGEDNGSGLRATVIAPSFNADNSKATTTTITSTPAKKVIAKIKGDGSEIRKTAIAPALNEDKKE